MRWIVGLDLHPGSEGPVRFARWLAETGRADRRVLYVHVLEEEHLRFALRKHHLDEVTAAARASAERLLSSAGASGEVRVVQGLTAEDALAQVRAEVGADGIVVGRHAGREGFHVVRLGRVARRLLRAAPCPVAVVPPDFRGEQAGKGPVAALASLADDALGACRLGASLASELGRPFAVWHVARPAELPYLPGPGLALEARRADAQAALERWIAEKRLAPDRVEILLGSPVERALERAEQEGVPLLVAGSRRLSAADRAFQGSTGSTLAATAKVPIVVAPAPA